jgi:hypothetical protein
MLNFSYFFSIASHKERIIASVSSSDANNHKSLVADQKQTLVAQVSTHDASS